MSIVRGGVQRGRIRSGNEDEGETRTRGNIPGQDWIGVNQSCVRMGSDTKGQNKKSSPAGRSAVACWLVLRLDEIEDTRKG